jgi:pimeloyl-ACP methyl ester carboxylesterase
VESKIRDALNLHRGQYGEVIFVGHSFGTYILSRILSEKPDMQADRVLLCGSIVSRTYRWDKLPNRPEAVLNEVGSRDIWPILANSLTWGYGSTGTFGFQTPGVRDRYHNLAHSDYFKPGFAEDYWVPWIREGMRKSTPYETDERPPTPFYKNLFEIVPLKWVLLTLLALAIFMTIRPYWLVEQATVGETHPRTLDRSAEARPAALAPMLATAPVPLGDKFVGRTRELGEFDQAWQSLWNGTNPAQRIVAVVAWGGFGKTALVRQWLYLKDKHGWPGATAPEGIFWWTFGKTADADGFLNDAIAYFSGKAPEPGSLQSDYQKLDALRRAVGNQRFLLVLDGLEAVQRGARGEDFGKTTTPLLASILKELASGKFGTGLSVITSRLPLTDPADLRDGSVVEIPLEQRPLELVDARLLLKLEGVTNATDAERDAIIEWCDRHPLALKTLARTTTAGRHLDGSAL